MTRLSAPSRPLHDIVSGPEVKYWRQKWSKSNVRWIFNVFICYIFLSSEFLLFFNSNFANSSLPASQPNGVAEASIRILYSIFSLKHFGDPLSGAGVICVILSVSVNVVSRETERERESVCVCVHVFKGI